MGRGASGRLQLIAALSAMAAVGACSAPELPDRSDPEVQAEESRLAEIIGADASILDGARGTCAVRLLRHVEAAAFVWAECEAGPPHNIRGMTAPMRVVGSQVNVVRSEQDLRAMFPDDLAELVWNERGTRLYP